MNEQAVDRIRPITWLNGFIEQESDIPHIIEHELQAKRIHEQYGILPTIGCEVEVKWSTLFPAVASKYFGDQDTFGTFERKYSDLTETERNELNAWTKSADDLLKPFYEATISAGIPQGNDAYWEFANAPAYSSETLAAEVGALMQYGLIPEGYPHSLHVTLGGIEKGLGGAALVLSALELMFCSSQRIENATQVNRYGRPTIWARRGADGIRSRDASVLKLGQTAGFELRTLTASSAELCSDILSSAQMLSAALQSYRKREAIIQPQIQALADVWKNFRTDINQLWAQQQLPAKSWGAPHSNKELWLKWAACVGQAKVEGTLESRYKDRFQELISEAKDHVTQL